MVDCFLVLVAPGGGDNLQGIKRGIIELADIVVVTKADGALRAAADTTAADYASALHLLRPKTPEWTPTVVRCSAAEGTGIDELWATVVAFGDALRRTGALTERRGPQAPGWAWGANGPPPPHRGPPGPPPPRLPPRLPAAAGPRRRPPPV